MAHCVKILRKYSHSFSYVRELNSESWNMLATRKHPRRGVISTRGLMCPPLKTTWTKIDNPGKMVSSYSWGSTFDHYESDFNEIYCETVTESSRSAPAMLARSFRPKDVFGNDSNYNLNIARHLVAGFVLVFRRHRWSTYDLRLAVRFPFLSGIASRRDKSYRKRAPFFSL